ncbi:MAG: polyprenyl synthetase family protein [Flavobacteriaceae bacterium]|nr:polyprenyl synthetase family protein [Flavobacteriaceae bacterium]
MLSIEKYRKPFLKYLEGTNFIKEPAGLYEPIKYILNLGGKRLRPALVLMSCEAFGTKYIEALNAALAVEVFHNFSLVHDDIMDEAPLRRGKETVHKKWNLNTGILSGDAMMIMAYQLFENYQPHKFKALAELFSKTALEVCEGQQYDIDFETRNVVTINEYLKMIEYKTAVLVAASLKMGAIIADASEKDAQSIYDYGLNLGIAFQLQDDYLDIFGGSNFGKQKAGDIIENKKTWLYLKTLELADHQDRENLKKLYASDTLDIHEKIEQVMTLYKKYKVDSQIEIEIEKFTNRALKCCKNCSLHENFQQEFNSLAQDLMHRTI